MLKQTSHLRSTQLWYGVREFILLSNRKLPVLVRIGKSIEKWKIIYKKLHKKVKRASRDREGERSIDRKRERKGERRPKNDKENKLVTNFSFFSNNTLDFAFALSPLEMRFESLHCWKIVGSVLFAPPSGVLLFEPLEPIQQLKSCPDPFWDAGKLSGWLC